MRFTFSWFRVRVRFSVTFGPMVRVRARMRVRSRVRGMMNLSGRVKLRLRVRVRLSVRVTVDCSGVGVEGG